MSNFLKLAFGVLKTMVPAIGTVEEAVKTIKAGAEKKSNVLKIVKASPIIIEMLAGKEIVDEKLFNESLDKLNDALVGIMNSTKKVIVTP